jgi:hypothetical protein
LKHLTLSGCACSPFVTTINQKDQKLSTMFPLLETLDLSFGSNFVDDEFLQHHEIDKLTELKYLNLSENDSIDHPAVPLLNANLEELHLDGIAAPLTNTLRFRNGNNKNQKIKLSVLSLCCIPTSSSTTNFWKDAIPHIASLFSITNKISSLTSLDFSENQHFDDNALVTLGKSANLFSLKKLNLFCVPLLTSEGLRTFFELSGTVHTLEFLDVSCNQNIQDDFWLPQVLQNDDDLSFENDITVLRELHLEGCEKITRHSIVAINALFGDSLKVLNVSCCPLIDDDCFSTMNNKSSKFLHRLEALNLCCCMSVTGSSLLMGATTNNKKEEEDADHHHHHHHHHTHHHHQHQQSGCCPNHHHHHEVLVFPKLKQLLCKDCPVMSENVSKIRAKFPQLEVIA